MAYMCYRDNMCVTGTICVLQGQYVCYRDNMCATGTICVLQGQYMCYRDNMCVTGTISMINPTANNNTVPLLMHPLSF